MGCIKQIQYFTKFYSQWCTGITGFAQQSYNHAKCAVVPLPQSWHEIREAQGKSMNFSKWRAQSTQRSQRCGTKPHVTAAFPVRFSLHQIHGRVVQTENNTWYKDIFFFFFFLNSDKISIFNHFPTFWTFLFSQDHTWVLMLLRFLLELSTVPFSEIYGQL